MSIVAAQVLAAGALEHAFSNRDAFECTNGQITTAKIIVPCHAMAGT